MKLICGLGNPGKEYKNTRHNVGFMVIDNYCEGQSFSLKFNGEYIQKKINEETVIFLKPLSYMNLSGEVVKKYRDYFNINDHDILVIRDDLDLPLGRSRIKFDSSSGGDNGVKSIIHCLGNQDFYQYKIGISNNKQIDTKDYVLGKFNNEERKVLEKVVENSKEVINNFIESKIEKNTDYFYGE